MAAPIKVSSEVLHNLSEKFQSWSKAWPQDALDRWWEIKANALLSALDHCHHEAPLAVVWGQAKNSLEALFALDVDDHALDTKPVTLGFDPTETQLNTAIGWFLNAEGSICVARNRVRAFLKSLYENRSDKKSTLSSFDDSAKFEVVSEKSVTKHGSGRRMDLVIGWPSLDSRNCQHLVIIEVKFGHHVTVGQLSSYREFAWRLMKGDMSNTGLFLLTPDGGSSKRNSSWVGISWLMLLRNWEYHLASIPDLDAELDFANLRSMLWQRIH